MFFLIQTQWSLLRGTWSLDGKGDPSLDTKCALDMHCMSCVQIACERGDPHNPGSVSAMCVHKGVRRAAQGCAMERAQRDRVSEYLSWLGCQREDCCDFKLFLLHKPSRLFLLFLPLLFDSPAFARYSFILLHFFPPSFLILIPHCSNACPHFHIPFLYLASPTP